MIALSLSVATASATAVNVSICGELSVSFTDVNDLEPLLADDYILDNSDRAARGSLLAVTNNTTSVTTEYVLPDADPACTSPIAMDTANTYQIVLKARAEVNGVTARVWTCDGTQSNCDGDPGDKPADSVWAHVAETSWSPTVATVTKTVNTGNAAAWNILAAATWALHRRNGGLSGDIITFYTQTCPGLGGGVSCINPANERLYIDPLADGLKYVIAHELGHYVAWERAGGAPARAFLTSVDGDCQADDGPMIQKRDVGLAADEGLAWYFAAVAFNQTDQTDCDFYRTGHDWDQDMSPGEDNVDPNDEGTPSCQGRLAEGWSAFDYIDNMCGGTLEDRGVYLDWKRAFWDADATFGLTTTEIFDLYEEADPVTWDPDGGSGSDDPEERLHDAAVILGIDSEWDDSALGNGVH